MRLIVVVIMIIFGTPNAFSRSSCASLIGSCDYYECLGADLRCPSENYLRSFGGHYCQLFDHVRDDFSAQGNAFLDLVKPCLQVQLERDLPTLTCEEISEAALGHHVKCYTESGFCELPLGQRLKIGKFIFGVLASDQKFRRTALQIDSVCRLRKAARSPRF